MAFVKNRAGDVVEVSDDIAKNAGVFGYTLASPEEIAAIQAEAARKAEFSTLGQQVIGGAEALASGASLGFSTPLQVALGADPERIKGRREGLGGLGTALEFTGAVAPIVLSGGLATPEVAAGQVAGRTALQTAARAMPTVRLSEAAAGIGERAATALFGETAAGVAPTLAQSLGRGAVQSGVSELVESVPYAAGQVATEAALGDLDLLSEEAAMTVGLGTILGGGLGAAFGAAGGGLGHALRKSQGAVDRTIAAFEKRYPAWIAGQVGADVDMLERGFAQRRRLAVDPNLKAEDLIGEQIPEVAPVAPFVKAKPPDEAIYVEGPDAPTLPDLERPLPYAPQDTVTVAGRQMQNPVLTDKQESVFAKDLFESLRETQAGMRELQDQVNQSLRVTERRQLLDGVVAPEVAEQKALEAAQIIDGFAKSGRADGPDSISGSSVRQAENTRDGILRNAFTPDTLPMSLRGAAETGVDQGGTAGVRESVVRTGANPQGERVLYEVIEADDAIPSHNPKTWRSRTDYPEGVQERPYSTSEGEQLKVTQVQQQFDPALPLANTITAVDGPPLVTGGAKRIVLGGNGRTMGMQLAFESPAAAKAYRDELTRRASSFGIDPASFAKMKKPMLVRTVVGLTDTSPVADLTAAGRRYNESLTRSMDAMARGVSDAKMLSAASVDDVAAMFDSAPDRTFGQLLAERGSDIVTALRRDKVITDQNAAEWVTGSDKLTSAGKDRVEAMFFGRILGSPERYGRVKGDLSARLERAIPYLVKVEAKNPGLSETAVVRRAVDMLADIEASGGKQSLNTLARQTGLAGLGGTADPVVVSMARLLSESSVADVGKAFRAWSKRASQPTDLAAKSLSREESRRLLMGPLANDVPAGRIAADVVDPDAGKAAAFAAPVGGAAAGSVPPPAAAAVAAAGARRSPTEVYNAIEDAIQQLQKERANISMASPQGSETKRRLNATIAALKAITTDESAWGAAAVRQKAINDKWASLISAEDVAMKFIANKEGRGSAARWVIDEDKVRALAKKARADGDPGSIQKVYRLLDRYSAFRDEVQQTADTIGAQTNRETIDSAEKRARELFAAEKEARVVERGERKRVFSSKREQQQWSEWQKAKSTWESQKRKERAAVEEARKSAAAVKMDEFKESEALRKEAIKKAEDDAAIATRERAQTIKDEAKAWRAGAKWNGFMDIIGAGAVGQNPILAPFFVAYRFGKYLGSPDKTMRVLNELERQSLKARKAVDALAEQFARGERVRAVRAASSLAMSEAAIDSIVNDPESAVDVLAGSTAELRDFAPETAQRVEGTIINAAQYLASIRPKPSSGPMGTTIPPSAASVAQYESTKAVVEHPLDAYVLASEGRLMPRHVAALEQVWPKMLSQLRVATLDALVSVRTEGKTPSFRVLQQASVIFGQDLTQTVASGPANQRTMNEKPQQAQASPARADKVTQAQRSQTPWASEGN